MKFDWLHLQKALDLNSPSSYIFIFFLNLVHLTAFSGLAFSFQKWYQDSKEEGGGGPQETTSLATPSTPAPNSVKIAVGSSNHRGAESTSLSQAKLSWPALSGCFWQVFSTDRLCPWPLPFLCGSPSGAQSSCQALKHWVVSHVIHLWLLWERKSGPNLVERAQDGNAENCWLGPWRVFDHSSILYIQTCLQMPFAPLKKYVVLSEHPDPTDAWVCSRDFLLEMEGSWCSSVLVALFSGVDLCVVPCGTEPATLVSLAWRTNPGHVGINPSINSK